MQTEYSLFDVEAYLEDRMIEYHTAGEKNVSRGWIGIECPLPGCDDPSWHCGINLESKVFKCYHCGEKGAIPKLICHLEGCSYAEANSIVEKYTNELLNFRDEYRYTHPEEIIACRGDLVGRNGDYKNILPREATQDFPGIHVNYLEGRGFDPQQLIHHYRLLACRNLGPYKFRIIIPIYHDNRVVSFTTRDVTDRNKGYRDQPSEQSIIPVKECVYNIDRVKDTVLIEEGPFDVWRVGDGAVCTFTTNFGMAQVRKIVEKRPERIFTLYDNEPKAQRQAERLCSVLQTFLTGSHIERLNIEDVGDPAELSFDDVRVLRKEIGL